jgi:hypothetical protein
MQNFYGLIINIKTIIKKKKIIIFIFTKQILRFIVFKKTRQFYIEITRYLSIAL